MIICKENYLSYNQYFEVKTKLFCNEQLKTGAQLPAIVAIIGHL